MTVLCDVTAVQDDNFRVEKMTMKGLVSTTWAKLQPVLWSSQSVVVPKTVGHSRKACTRHLEVSKRLRYLALIVLASLTLATAAAADEDEKAYPGAMCQPSNNAANILRDEHGRMFNGGAAGQTQTVICPVVKDITADNDPEFARITVIGDVRCTFRSRDQNGAGTASISPNSVIPGNIAVHQYGLGDDNVGAGVQDGYYYFLCVIAGRSTNPDVGQGGLSGIISYKVTEQDED